MRAKDGPFCVLPWLHVFIDPEGYVFPCCVRDPQASPMTSANGRTFMEIFNSEEMKKLRLEFLADGSKSKYCTGCVMTEKLGGVSHRDLFEQDFGHLVQKQIEKMTSDGTIESPEVAYIDFRLSNVCNLRCRSCGPVYSSSLKQDWKKLEYPLHDSGFSIEDKNGIFN